MADLFVPFTSDDTSVDYHQLLRSFMPENENDEGPTIRAAELDDSSTLLAILQRSLDLSEKDRSTYVVDAVYAEDMARQKWDTPLLSAIMSEKMQNINLLLEYGANPNGADREAQASYARRFRRVRSQNFDPKNTFILTSQEDVGDADTQLLPLSHEELAQRSVAVSCFWTLPEALPLDYSENGSLLHSLLMSASKTTEVLDRLLEAGADRSAWTVDTVDLLSEDLLSPSLLCVSTPLHAAIDLGSSAMLEGLLARGFSPNARAWIVGSQALTPLQHAIVNERPEFYRKLAAHQLADANLVTPVLEVHALHLAVAKLSLDLINATSLPLSTASTTALGHTLLHVACLPLDETYLQFFAPRVRQSVHDIRTLDLRRSSWPAAIHGLAPSRAGTENAPAADGPGDPGGVHDQPTWRPVEERVEGSQSDRLLAVPPTDDFDRQLEIVKKLVSELGPAEILKGDVYGNTALHYLASTRVVNDQAIAWLRGQEYGQQAWRTAVNRWGWTPSDLWKDNVITIEPSQERLRNESTRGRNVLRAMSSRFNRGRR